MFLKIHSKLLSFRKYFSKLKNFLLPPLCPYGRKSGYGPECRNLLIRRNVLKDLSLVAVVPVQGSVVNICSRVLIFG